MNVVTRGIKNATRSPLKSGAIVLMFAISIALILSMLVARGSVLTKINEVKASSGTAITISPAGVQGGFGGGDPLSAAQVTTIKNTANVSSITSTLTDQMTTSDTNLTSSLELGAFGRRQNRETTSSSTDISASTDTATPDDTASTTETTPPAMTPRITVTGTTDVNSVSTDGSALKLTSGSTIDADGSENVALVGSSLATKNSLSVGSTFTAYGQTITVSGIYSTGNTFQDSGIIMPLTTVQTLTDQAGDVSSVKATVNSSDNVSSTVTALKSALGTDKADITSEAETAAASVSSLQGIASLTLAGVIASAAAGAFIVILMMFLVVRERRREIGIIKAIGGSNAKVITQFIVEGFTLTIIGAIIGIVLGVLVSGPMTTSLVSNSQNSNTSSTSATSTSRRGGFGGGAPGEGFGGAVRGGAAQLNTNLTQVKASLTPQIFLAAVGITLLIALLGSAIPAWLTSRVRPAEVLRTE